MARPGFDFVMGIWAWMTLFFTTLWALGCIWLFPEHHYLLGFGARVVSTGWVVVLLAVLWEKLREY